MKTFFVKCPEKAYYLAGIIFFLTAIVFICMRPVTIIKPINIDYKSKTFSGTLPPLLIIAGISFIFLGARKKEDKLKEAKDALENAVDKICGRIVTVRVRFGIKEQQEHYRSCLEKNTLSGFYSLVNQEVIIKKESISFFEDYESNTVMAEFRNLPYHDDSYLIFEINDGTQKFKGIENLKTRIINLKINDHGFNS